MAEPPRRPVRGTNKVPLAVLSAAVGGERVGGDVEVTDVVHSSLDVPRGALFAAVVGGTTDGHDHAAAAVDAGAAAVLCQHRLDLDVPQIVVDDSRVAMARAAATCWGEPSRSLRVVGVTGTNGKTTVVSLLGDIWASLGLSGSVVGTLTGVRTTPESTDLQALLAQLVSDGVELVAMEVSSHALALSRVEGVHFSTAVFTNLGRDHLDFHGSMERYFEAKSALFDPARSDVSVLDVDDPYGRLLADVSPAGHPVVTVGLADARALEVRPSGSRFTWRGYPVSVGLVGRFNVSNVLAAAAAAVATGADPEAVSVALAGVRPPAGRFELVDVGQPFLVVVDYAHTPEGLERVLEAARELTDGRLAVVFGAGGDRDRSKRPRMGEVASRLADTVVVTSDNPRSEDPSAIMAAVVAGAVEGPVRSEPDRRRAIEAALADAAPGDVVVLAGKGHETTQTIGAEIVPFDDRVVAAEALTRLGFGAP